jgi:hypothetical protein
MPAPKPKKIHSLINQAVALKLPETLCSGKQMIELERG